MAKINANNQIGNIVLFFLPIPNSLKAPNLLYRKTGLKY